MDTEVFDLAWRDFPAHLAGLSSALLEQEALMDISIQCGSETVRAHRLVLSACSPWFQEVIATLPASPAPVVALWDCPARVFRALLAFMYRGRIQVPQDDLPHFLKTAERLQVKGLVEREGEGDDQQEEVKEMEEFERLTKEMEKEEEKPVLTPKVNRRKQQMKRRKEEMKLKMQKENTEGEEGNNALAAKREAEKNVRNTLLQAEVKKENVVETRNDVPDAEKTKKQRIRELRVQALKDSMEAKERRKELEESNVQPSEEGEKTKAKKNARALREKALKEAMEIKKESEEEVLEKLLEPLEPVEDEEDECFDPSTLVEAEMEEPEDDADRVTIPTDDVLLNTTPDGRVFCTVCRGGPMQRKHLTTHMRHKHGGETFECGPCDKKFTCKQYLTNHQRSSCKERFRKLREEADARSKV